MKNKIKDGKSLQYTATAAIVSGEVVPMNDLHGVAITDAAIGEVVEVLLSGVFEIPKEAPLVINQGDMLYWDIATKKADKTNTNKFIGYAVVAAGSADTTVQCKLK